MKVTLTGGVKGAEESIRVFTVLRVALASALPLGSCHGDGVVPPGHDQHADHLLDAVHDEVAAHFLNTAQASWNYSKPYFQTPTKT